MNQWEEGSLEWDAWSTWEMQRGCTRLDTQNFAVTVVKNGSGKNCQWMLSPGEAEKQDVHMSFKMGS